MSDLSFEAALTAIRNGASYSLSGLTLIVNGIALAITDEQFDIAYDVMDEVDGYESMFSIRGGQIT